MNIEGTSFGKIVPMPNAGANDNFEKEPETFVPDIAKVASIRHLVDQTYERGNDISLWSDTNKAETRSALAGYTLKDAIREINAATEEAVSKRPTYYAALLDMLDEQTEDTQAAE